ncbi:hypothetical protein MHYP_G00088260 [Metynnis hypsauchen]
MWLHVLLLYSVVQGSSGCTVDRGLGDTITKPAGDSVELLCSCTQQTKFDPQTVQWGYRNLTKEDSGRYTCRADEKDMPYVELEVTAAGHISFLLHVLLRVSESGCPLAVSYRRITQTTAAGKAGGAQFSDCSDSSGSLITLSVCVALLLIIVIGESAVIYKLIHNRTQGCTVDRGLGDTITKSAGDSVELLCSCTQQTEVDPQTVQWGFTKKFVQGQYRADHSVFPEDGSQNQRYRGRVQRLNQTKPGTVALIISNLTEKDEGAYLCGNKGNYNRAVLLYIRDLTKEDSGAYTCRADEKDMPYVQLEVTAAGHISFLLHVLLRVSESGCPLAVSYRRITQTTAAGKAGGAQFSDCSANQTSHNSSNPVVNRIIICISVLLLILFLLLGGAACTFWKYRKAHGKDNPAEDDVTYSSIVHGQNGQATQRQAEEDVIYSDVTFHRLDNSAEREAEEEDVTYSDVVFIKGPDQQDRRYVIVFGSSV